MTCKCSKCNPLNKAAIATALQTAIQGGDTTPAPVTINAEISGYIPAGSDNGSQQSIYGYGSYDPDTYGVVPVIESASGHNPQCDGEGNSIGTLVIDPKLPAGSSDQFDLSTIMLDNSGGGGGVFLFCPATGQYTANQSSVSSSFGNNTGPVAQTHTLDASSLACDIQDVRIGINAWGVSSDYEGDPRCDSLSAEIGTLVVVTPSICAPALACFEEWFGCSLSDMASAAGIGASADAKLESLTIPRIVWTLNDAVEGFSWKRWGPRDGRTGDDVEDFEAAFSGPVVNGIPTHTDGDPTASGVETDTRFSQSERGQDEHELVYCIDNRASDKDLEIVDTDARAESLRVYTGCKCASELTYERYQGEGTPWNSNGNAVAVIPAGQVRLMTVLIHDPGPDFSGFNPIGNYVGETDAVDFISWQRKPTVTHEIIQQVLCDLEQELLPNQSYTPIELPCHNC